MKYLLLAILLPIMASASDPYSEAGTTVMQSLKIPFGSKQVAMGNTGIATDNDAMAMLWNPAAISLLETKSLVLEHSLWLIGINQDYLGYAMPLGSGAIGLGLRSFYLGDIEARSQASADPEYYFSSLDIATQLVYALPLGPEVDIGLAYKWLYSKLDDAKGSGHGLDLGIRYHLVKYNLELGFALLNFELNRFGVGQKISFDDNEYQLPMTYRVGGNWKIRENGMNLTLEIAKPVDNYWSYSAGFEYPIYSFALRTGIQVIDDNIIPTFGFGYHENRFQIDLATYQPVNDLDLTSRISLKIEL
jgi:hypothetical protein